MAIDTHIKLDGVEGEAKHKDHKGEIEVLTWNWQVVNASAVAGGGSGLGKATPGEFVFVHNYDKASPVLAKNCASGKHFPTAVVTARKAGEGQKDFLKVSMKEVFVTSVTPGGKDNGELKETVTLSYGSIEFAYKPQDDKGQLGGEVKCCWDVKTTEVT